MTNILRARSYLEFNSLRDLIQTSFEGRVNCFAGKLQWAGAAGRGPATKTYELNREQWVPSPHETIFDFFSHPANLQVLTPPWLDFRITEAPEKLSSGSLIRYELRIHKIRVRWTTEITEWNPPDSFTDNQLSGPYSLWRHQHRFTADRNGTLIQDAVSYALPLGPLGRLAHWALVRQDVERIFGYRAEKMRELFGA